MMKSLTPRTIYFFSNSPSHLILSHLYSSSSLLVSSNGVEESKQVKVSVWWDFENCSIPSGANVFKIKQRITSALRINRIRGPISITAFGDMMQLSRASQEALFNTGVCLNHIPNGGKTNADMSLLVDLISWTSQNPPPAHLFLISGDGDFANIMHQLRMKNYNILIASQNYAPRALCSASSIMWNWNSLVNGGNIVGKHLNDPPDGPNSWYGHHKGVLEDPFSDTCFQAKGPHLPAIDPEPQPILKSKQAKYLPTPIADLKPQSVSRSIMVDHTSQILNSHPNGILLSELYEALEKNNATMDNEFFGYGKFLHLLNSEPKVFKVRSAGNDFRVYKMDEWAEMNLNSEKRLESSDEGRSRAASAKDGGNSTLVTTSSDLAPKSVELVESKLKLKLDTGVENCRDQCGTTAAELNSTNSAVAAAAKDNLFAVTPPTEPILKLGPDFEISKRDSGIAAAKLNNENSAVSTIVKKNLSTKGLQLDHIETGSNLPVEKEDYPLIVGFYKKLLQYWSGNGTDSSRKEDIVMPEKDAESVNNFAKEKFKEKSADVKSHNHNDSLDSASFSSLDVNESVMQEKPAACSKENDDNSTTGFFSQILSWCKSWRMSETSSENYIHVGKEVNQIKNKTAYHTAFSKSLFWDDMESFVHSPSASALISWSRTREELAKELQKEGPLVLKTFSADDLLHLVQLLIFEKRWIDEFLTENCPFVLVHSGRNPSSTAVSNPYGSNRLSHLFSGNSPSQSNDQRPRDHEKAIENQNLEPFGTSTGKMIAHCEKLVRELLEESPKGFNMQQFSEKFQKQFGYSLSFKKLGYKKLSSLLQTIPGVKVEGTLIQPAGRQSSDVNLGCKLSDSRCKENEGSSPWEELGPVSETSSKRCENGSVPLNTITKGKDTEYCDFGDDSYLLDEELSDLEETSVTEEKVNGESGDNSSSLEILVTWNDSKNEKVSPDCLEIADIPRNDVKLLVSSGFGSKKKNQIKNKNKKVNFVTDPDTEEDTKSECINGLFASLNSTGSKMQT
ncbi:hypothetical protein GIB67_029229 [Kingdonia uniflora]|uniref:HTH OST-type domain-containing protein n=1 Tax=Kingdonia uniflora TaxID=39325 RepID=A0A7J7N8N9_9MAGN|nr:hypothetical protein GIB67_029229 [Kingdonia uniflora]